MRASFDISPRLPVRAELAKQVARFCMDRARKPAAFRGMVLPQVVHFKMVTTRAKNRSGRAQRNLRLERMCHRANPRVQVFLRVGVHDSAYIERYHRYADSPTCLVDGTVECLVHLVAHEVGHAVVGYDGHKAGEFCCERFAAACLEGWREATQDPACMV